MAQKHIKYTIAKILSLWVYLYHLLLHRNIIIKKSIVFFNRFTVQKNNNVYLRNSIIYKCKIFVKGKNNKIMIKGKLVNSLISVVGDDNVIYFDNILPTQKLKLIIRGKNCFFYVGKMSTFCEDRIVCMGIDNYIKIGNECMFADNVEIWATDSHPIYNENGNLINKSKPIIIGNNVWVGARTCILKGVEIGNNVIIGMSSVVVKNINSNTINVGNPTRVIKEKIFHWERNFITN